MNIDNNTIFENDGPGINLWGDSVGLVYGGVMYDEGKKNKVDNNIIYNNSGSGIYILDKQILHTLINNIEENNGEKEPDSDGDGIPDHYEWRHDFYPHFDDTMKDNDGDGLTNLEEYLNGTNPNRIDTDDDGLSDYEDPNPLKKNIPQNEDRIDPLFIWILGIITIIIILYIVIIRFTTNNNNNRDNISQEPTEESPSKESTSIFQENEDRQNNDDDSVQPDLGEEQNTDL
jgi:hypothetical protein